MTPAAWITWLLDRCPREYSTAEDDAHMHERICAPCVEAAIAAAVAAAVQDEREACAGIVEDRSRALLRSTLADAIYSRGGT